MTRKPDQLVQPYPTKMWTTLVELLQWRASHQPAQRAFTFLADGESEEAQLNYRELNDHAHAIAARLQQLTARGERALLLYPQSLDYIAAFFGCLNAGVIAVPAYPPALNKPSPRIEGILADAQPSIVLSTHALLPKVRRWFEETVNCTDLDWLATDSIGASLAAEWIEPALSGDTIAFLQYTSGSTASPKGVMVSHANLLHNERMITTAFRLNEQSIGVGWLPLYHDMGLIGLVLQPLYLGFPCYLMSPVAFLQKPARWLQAISRYRGTISPAPNFAYDLCVQKITPEQRAALDLSSWAQALNGAEPVRAATLERFAEMFVPCGFRREAFYPCYGLAEATLVVTGAKGDALPVVRAFDAHALEQNRVVAASARDDEARMLVSSGRNLPDQRIMIVDPDTGTRCPPDRVGEIWVAGPSLTRGYWNRAEETEQTFGAFHSHTREGPFLRTGDLGFMQSGELFVTGRTKDLIIIRGRNHYPQDIELTVEASHPALQPNSGAAFSVDSGGQERLVIVHELKREQRHANVDEVVRATRAAVAEEHELQVYAMRLLRPASIPRTSSGKIQRRACRAALLAGTLNVISAWNLADDTETTEAASREPTATLTETSDAREPELRAWLQAQVARILEMSASLFDVSQPLARLGLDSLGAIQLQFQIEEELGVTLPVENLDATESIADLAARLLPLVPQTSLALKPTTRAPLPGRAVPAHVAAKRRRQHILSQLLGPVVRKLWDISAVGVEFVPSAGAFILCPNHESYLDPVWISACLPIPVYLQLTWMVMREAFDNRLMRPWVTHVGVTISVDRLGNPAPALRHGLEILQAGEPLVLFPEGTMSRDGKLGKFKRGAAWLALKTGASLIPTRIDGAYEIYRSGALFPRLYDWRRLRRMKVRVAFGAPLVPPYGTSGREAEEHLTERLRAAVITLGESQKM